MSDKKAELIQEIRMTLGEPMVRVELADEQVGLGIRKAFQEYRKRCSNAVEEAFLYLHMIDQQDEYTLPDNVQEVKKIYRRGNGVVSGSGSTVDPFSLAYSNTYLLSAVRGSTGGGLLTYELYHQFDETVGRLFGRDIIFQWNSVSKKIKMHRQVKGPEDVMLHVFHQKPDDMLYADAYASPWLRDWAIAECKLMLGRVRGKMSNLVGPQGGVSLDGDTLRQEGEAEKEKLLDDLMKYTSGGRPIGFFFG